MNSIMRKSKIIDALNRDGSIDVHDLAKKLKVSEVTIRRDLAELSKEHVIRRTHGGAILNEDFINQQQDLPYHVRGVRHYDEKILLCKYAVKFINDNDIIYIDNSSTLQYLPRFLSSSMHLTILTNSIGLLNEASRLNNYNHTYVCLGGIFNNGNNSTYGQIALMNAKAFYPNKAFVSCANVSMAAVVTDSSIHELDLKAFIIQHARESFLLADSSKFNNLDKFFLCHLNSFSHLVTNADADLSGLTDSMESNLQIHLVE